MDYFQVMTDVSSISIPKQLKVGLAEFLKNPTKLYARWDVSRIKIKAYNIWFSYDWLE
jgi:hypothetical protein